MQLNKSIIRGALKLSCANPNITAAVHGTIKPLLITTTNAKFSNDITVFLCCFINSIQCFNLCILH